MSEEELKRLIEKFYSGASTDEEERALRNYFIENNAPPGYEAEKEIFSFLMEAGEVPEPSAGFENRIIKAVDSSSERARSSKIRRVLVPLMGAAAGLLILAGSYFFFLNRIESEDTYTDPEIAYAETVKILMDVSSKMNHATSPLKPVGKINKMKIKSFESINKSAILVEKNLKSLGYLRNSAETDLQQIKDK
jgi:hypothetical protein